MSLAEAIIKVIFFSVITGIPLGLWYFNYKQKKKNKGKKDK
jgi:ABC-type proline/glycine betaine transport system permease subunit